METRVLILRDDISSSEQYSIQDGIKQAYADGYEHHKTIVCHNLSIVVFALYPVAAKRSETLDLTGADSDSGFYGEWRCNRCMCMNTAADIRCKDCGQEKPFKGRSPNQYE